MSERKEVLWIAGGDGLVGRHIVKAIDNSKYDLVILSRKKNMQHKNNLQYVFWDTDQQFIQEAPAPDHIINLAGLGIADETWTDKRKAALVSSRVNSAITIKKYIESRNIKPKSYISASAVGYYGDRGEEILTEESHKGNEFMSECCAEWEKAAAEAGALCDRMAIVRIGIVLSTLGGALPKMLMTRSIGIYNFFGNGKQFYPWIHIYDLSNLFLTVIENDRYQGIYNAVAPQEITNKDMMMEIKQVNRLFGVLLPAPEFVLRAVLGEMANVVLNSNRVQPVRLMQAGFNFKFTNAGEAVKDLMLKGI
jgi:uncharacterized protein